MPNLDTLSIVALIFGSGGVVAALTAWLKAKPEATRIVVSAAEGAVIVQTGVITTLQEEIKRLNKEHGTCQEEIEDLHRLLDLINDRHLLRRRTEDEEQNTKRRVEDESSRVAE